MTYKPTYTQSPLGLPYGLEAYTLKIPVILLHRL
jgi:hypothetical protein